MNMPRRKVARAPHPHAHIRTQADMVAAIEQGIESANAGRVRAAEEVFDRLEAYLKTLGDAKAR